MNSSPIERKNPQYLNPDDDDDNDDNFVDCAAYPYANGKKLKRIGPKAGPLNALEVAYNHSSSIMDFSPPFTLDGSSACGVALMSGGGGTITCPANDCNNPVENLPTVVAQTAVCSIEDVNGDGLADRLEGAWSSSAPEAFSRRSPCHRGPPSIRRT